MSEQHVIVTNYEREGKAPLIHVYGFYKDRPTAQRSARKVAREEGVRATAHKVILDVDNEWVYYPPLINGLDQPVAEVPLKRLSAADTGLMPGVRPQRVVHHGWRTFALLQLVALLGIALAVSVSVVPWGL